MELGVVGSDIPMASTLTKLLQNLGKSGMEVLKGGCESERDGALSLHVQVDLLDIKKVLMDIWGQVDLGLKRVEMALHSLEMREGLGCAEKAGDMGHGERSSWVECMGLRKEAGAEGWFKPKKKKVGAGLLGSKPSKALVKVNQISGSMRSTHYRIPTSVQHQAGESSEMGAARVAEMMGMKMIWLDSEV